MEKLLVTVSTAQEALSIGRTKLYELLATGEIGPVVRIGRSIRIPAKALEQWVEERTSKVTATGSQEDTPCRASAGPES